MRRGPKPGSKAAEDARARMKKLNADPEFAAANAARARARMKKVWAVVKKTTT